jgi:hypothetical protein
MAVKVYHTEACFVVDQLHPPALFSGNISATFDLSVIASTNPVIAGKGLPTLRAQPAVIAGLGVTVIASVIPRHCEER